MRVAATGKKNFRQGDDLSTRTAERGQVTDLAGPGWQDARSTINLLRAKSGGASKNELMVGVAEGVVGGVLGENASEIRLRPYIAGSGGTVESQILSGRAFEGVIALVMDEGEAGTGDTSRQGEQAEGGRGEIRSEVAGFYAAVIEAVSDGIGLIGFQPSKLLAQIDFSFQSLRGESGDVEAVVVERSEEKSEILVVQKLGNLVADQAALLQGSHMRLEGKRLIAAANVKTSDIELDTGTDPGTSGGRISSGWKAGGEFQACTVSEGIAFSLLYLNQDILFGIGTGGVLNRTVDLAEDSEIVEFGLRIQNVLLAQRTAGYYLNFTLHNVIASVLQSRHEQVVHEKLFPFLNGVDDVLSVGVAGGWVRGDFKNGIGETVIKVIVEDGLAIVGKILVGVRLAGRVRKFGKRLGVNFLVSNDAKCTDERLRASLDLKVDGERGLRAVIVVVDFSLNLGLTEPVRHVE